MSTKRTISVIKQHLNEVFDTGAPALSKADVELARTLVEESKESYEIAHPYAERIARQLGLAPATAVVDGNTKALNRIFEKAHSQHNGDLERVPDVGRLRILVQNADQIRELREMFLGVNARYTKGKDDKVARLGVLLDQHPTNEITITEFEDYYWEPSSTGRIALHLGLKIRGAGSGSRPFEIQIIHEDMQATEVLTHDNYKAACKIERQAKSESRAMTDDEMRAIADYKESNRHRYAADMRNYDLGDLRHPRHQRMDDLNNEYTLVA